MARSTRAQWLLTVALVAYLGLGAYATLGPNPGKRLDRIDRVVEEAREGVRPDGAPEPSDDEGPWPFDLRTEDIGNIVMFMPLPILVAALWPRWWWVGAPLGIALSGTVELVQGAFLEDRTPSWSDWVLNSTGAVLGLVLWMVGARLLRRRRRHR